MTDFAPQIYKALHEFSSYFNENGCFGLGKDGAIMKSWAFFDLRDFSKKLDTLSKHKCRC